MHCEMFIPGKAFFGAGVVSKVVELIGNGVKRVFLVTDENLVRRYGKEARANSRGRWRGSPDFPRSRT